MSRRSGAGRYAPSPTGLLHAGNLRTALAAWASARAAGMRFLLRVEDIDRPRCKRELEARQLADLKLLGIDWDGEPIRQDERIDIYTTYFETLRSSGEMPATTPTRWTAPLTWSANWPTRGPISSSQP